MSSAVERDATDARVARLEDWLRERELDALLVQQLVDVRYVSGFTGSNALALIVSDAARERLGGHRLLTDFRYQTQVSEQVTDAFARVISNENLLEVLAAELASSEGRLAFDEAQLSFKGHGRLVELLAPDWDLVPSDSAVAPLRAVKEPQELARIRAASELADEALKGLLEAGLVGRSERELAIDLELRMRRLGAESASFPSIVAAGTHAALPHAEPRDRLLGRNELVIIDWGAFLDGYCSDCTRTYATGEGVSERARQVYEIVLQAQELGLAALTAGLNGKEVDAVARDVIERGGYGEQFGHGLGHGVGMEVHEGPRLSRTASEDPLLAGNVVTVEPGIYLPGELGVRIEDLVVVGEDGHEVLTGLPKTLTVVS